MDDRVFSDLRSDVIEEVKDLKDEILKESPPTLIPKIARLIELYNIFTGSILSQIENLLKARQ